MRRREFIAGFGSTAAAWPITAHAQQSERVRRVGVLMNLTASIQEASGRLAAFRQGLQQLGWTDGGNVRIEYRSGEGNLERLRKLAETSSWPKAVRA